MRFMVSFSPKPGHEAAIQPLLGAEQQRVGELRQAGALAELYVSRPGRAWLVMVADSPQQIEELISSLPLHPHVEATVESLIG